MRVLLALAALALLPATAVASKHCRIPRNAERNDANRYAVVWYTTGDPTTFTACSRTNGTLTDLGTDYHDDVYGSSDVDEVGLFGRYVLVTDSGFDHYGTRDDQAFLYYADSGAAVAVGGYNSDSDSQVRNYARIKLLANSAGTMVLLESIERYDHPTVLELTMFDGKGEHLLDSQEPGSIDQVHFRDHRLTWRSAGTPRSARYALRHPA